MERRERFDIIFAPEVREHLKSIETKHHSLIRQKIDEQLQFEPMTETKNRKPLQQPAAFAAEWEYRFGPNNRFRVLYRAQVAERTVFVLAIGIKVRNRLNIGGQEIEL